MLYKECGLLTVEGKQIKHKDEILQLLDTVIHCKGHQNVKDIITLRNWKADEAAKLAVEGST